MCVCVCVCVCVCYRPSIGRSALYEICYINIGNEYLYVYNDGPLQRLVNTNLFTALQFIFLFPFLSSPIVFYCHLGHSNVSIPYPSLFLFVLDEWQSDQYFIWTFDLIFIDDISCHCPFWPREKLRPRESFQSLAMSVTHSQTNIFLTWETFWSPDRNQSVRNVISYWPWVRRLSISGWQCRIFPFITIYIYIYIYNENDSVKVYIKRSQIFSTKCLAGPPPAVEVNS